MWQIRASRTFGASSLVHASGLASDARERCQRKCRKAASSAGLEKIPAACGRKTKGGPALT